MPSYTYVLTADSVSVASETGTAGEKFTQTALIANGASDVSVTLGTLTDPIYIIVKGAKGVSFKLGGAGTDAIGAYPGALISNNDGLGVSAILISNSDSQEHEVTIYAGE